MIHNHEVPGSIPGPATQNKVFMNLFHGYLVFLLFILDLFWVSLKTWALRKFPQSQYSCHSMLS